MPQTSSRSALLRALPILILTGILAAVIGYTAIGTLDAVRQNSNNNPFAACNGLTVSAASPYEAETPGIHPVLAYRQTGDATWILDPDATLPEWRPAATDALELVICIESNVERQAAVCDENRLVTFAYELPLVLYAAADGAEVARTTLRSSANQPDGCVPDPTVYANVAPVSTEQIWAWASPFVQVQ